MDENRPPPRSRSIYLLPNLFTTAGLFAGFYAIIAASNGQFVDASIAVFVAAVMDGLDGRVARLTGTSSEFGVQYDSLADLVSFGMAPALVMYHWSLDSLKFDGSTMGRVGWAAAFLYAACAALRLARFNTQVGVVDKRWFVGLASPAAAGLMMSFVWAFADGDLGWTGEELRYVALAVTITAGLLMVSRIRFSSFKGGGEPGPRSDRVPFLVLALVPVIIAILVIDLPRVLLAIGVIYALSGPGAVAVAALAAAAEDAVSEAACSALWTEQQHSWLQAMGYTLYLHGSALHAPEAEAEPAPPPAQARAPAAARPAAPAPGPRRTAPPVPAEMAPAPTTVTASASASPPSPRASALRLPDRLQMALLRASGCDPNAPETRALMESWPLAELRRNPAAKRALWPQLRALRRKPRP